MNETMRVLWEREYTSRGADDHVGAQRVVLQRMGRELVLFSSPHGQDGFVSAQKTAFAFAKFLEVPLFEQETAQTLAGKMRLLLDADPIIQAVEISKAAIKAFCDSDV